MKKNTHKEVHKDRVNVEKDWRRNINKLKECSYLK